MKTLFTLVFAFFILLSCGTGTQQENAVSESSRLKLNKSQVSAAMKKYLETKFTNPVSAENDGLIRVQGDGALGIMQPYGIFIGKINEDESEDAMVTYVYEETGKPAVTRHVVFLNTDSLRAVTELESDFNILAISKKTIITKIRTDAKDTPMPCKLCSDTVKYILKGDELVEIQ